MKTPLYILGIVAFSALMLSPKQLPDYPPKIIVQSKKVAAYKEQKINTLISQIECTLVLDSIQIEKQSHEQ
ncbi:hypothetical protein ACNQGP_00735 [Flavobacterium sp. GT2N3]|uniref:hypothetical protein n=1 Tax=unclassified Flavobacterium TaxID=196869 RepID=UPI003AAC5821